MSHYSFSDTCKLCGCQTAIFIFFHFFVHKKKKKIWFLLVFVKMVGEDQKYNKYVALWCADSFRNHKESGL